MVKKILKSSDPILRKKSLKVKKFDKKLLCLIEDLNDTLKSQKDPEGVGLAAPQIGVSLRVFLIDYENTTKTIINPKILSLAKISTKKFVSKKNQILEGCLSLPHYYGPLIRSPKVKVHYQDELGNEKVEIFSGFLAQIIQHEIDHLNGILFVDHILAQKKPLYKLVNNEWEEIDLA